MTPLLSFLLCALGIYIGFLVLTSAFSSNYIVVSRIASTLLGQNGRDIRLSTVVINKTGNVENREFGLVVLLSLIINNAGTAGSYGTKDLIIPLSTDDAESIIEILKQDPPIALNIGSKKQVKLVIPKDSSNMQFIFNSRFFFTRKFTIKTNENSRKDLISIFEALLKHNLHQ